jgi:amino acid adenylation domain-containing protein
MNTISDPGAPDTIGALERFWVDTLSQLIVTPAVPPDYSRPAGAPQVPPHEIDLQVPAAISAAALLAAEARPSWVFALVVTACKALVHRQSGADQVCVLTPVMAADPGQTGTNRWLAVRTEIDSDATVSELFEHVGNNLAGAFAHQEFPFARVLEFLGRAWPPNRAPLSDLAVAFEGISRMDVLGDVASDLTIVGSIEDAALRLRLAYRGDLFAAETIMGFGQRLVRVLELMLESPRSRVREVRLLSPEEEAEAIARFTARDFRTLPECRVEELVEVVARSMPNEAAFIHGPTTLKYGELVGQARAFAETLRRAGVQPGDRVAIALDLGVAVPVALLGTLFCGAAFVPLDPRHPVARLQSIVKQVEPAVMVAEARLVGRFEEHVRVIEWNPASLPDAGVTAPVDLNPGDNRALAYVMFTSGSTGEPNGVSVSHRSLVNYLLWAKEFYLGGERPVFSLFSSIAFDLTLTSVFLPLVSGSSTVIFAADVVDMNAIFSDPQVEVVKATPSHLKLLRPADVRGSGVRLLIVGGEAFDWGLAASLKEALGANAAIFNEYGPTEATIACMAHRFEGGDRPSGAVPVGRPIWNTGVYLVDSERNPVPACSVGHLWISGQAVAEGYFQRPELTRERFVDDTFVPGSRMYATGDRARYDASGNLYFLGRDDDQVKFNGVRVELNEIRSALGRLPRVRGGVVRILEDEGQNQIMVAYYVSRQPIDVSILRAGLMELLPLEMIPNLFFRMAKLPLTLNGKVDVGRLPGLEEVRAAAPQVFVAPQTPTEKAVAAVWSEVLGVGEISVHSNFFQLGGHSLLASQVVWKLTERLGVEMPLRLLFDTPTISQLAPILDNYQGWAPPAAPRRPAQDDLS